MLILSIIVAKKTIQIRNLKEHCVNNKKVLYYLILYVVLMKYYWLPFDHKRFFT